MSWSAVIVGIRGPLAPPGDDQRTVADVADRGAEAEPVLARRARSRRRDLEVPWNLLVEVREPRRSRRDPGGVARGGRERRGAQGDRADRRDEPADQALSRR